MTKKILALTILLIFVFSANALAAQEISFAYGGPGNLDSDAHVLATVLKSHVETATDGEIIINLYSDDQLGNERERMELLQENITQLNISTMGGLGQFYRGISALTIPYALPDSAVAWEVFDGEFGDYLREQITANIADVTSLAIAESGGFTIFTNNVRPIERPEDMEGLTFRVLEDPIQNILFEAVGASTSTIAWPEVYTSLQTGIVDGQTNPVTIIIYGNLYEVQEYATITNTLYGPYSVMANTEWWESLSEEHKNIFAAGLRMGKEAGRGNNSIIMATEGINILEEQGMQVNSLSPEGRQEFADVIQPAVLEYLENEYDEEVFELANMYLEAIEAAKERVYNITP